MGKRVQWSDEDAAEAEAMYRAGKSLAEVGEWLGRKPSSVRVMLLRHGVQMRAPHKHKGKS